MIKIRKAEKHEAAVIAEFNSAMALETESKTLDVETVTLAIEDVFDDPAKGFYIVAEMDGFIAGCLMITYEWSDWRRGWWWWVQSVYVKQDFRGRGVYPAMYSFIKTEAKAAGAFGIRLYVETNNTNAQKVYERLGMERSHYYMYHDEL